RRSRLADDGRLKGRELTATPARQDVRADTRRTDGSNLHLPRPLAPWRLIHRLSGLAGDTAARLVATQRDRAGEHFAGGGGRGPGADRDRLGQDVAQGGGLGRAGDDRPAAGIGGELRQQAVLAAA